MALAVVIIANDFTALSVALPAIETRPVVTVRVGLIVNGAHARSPARLFAAPAGVSSAVSPPSAG